MMSVQELEEMLRSAASNGRDISREDFYNMMTKKTFWYWYIITNFVMFFADKRIILIRL